MIDLVYYVYLCAAIGLALYSFNYLVMAGLYWRKRDLVDRAPLPEHYPDVTIALPIYNEYYVVERLIRAAAELDWNPRHLQIQVLDDSDDETSALAQARVEHFQRRGIDIQHIRRSTRVGFKAGALAAGFEQTRGEYVAIFDADFLPPPDFLKRTIPFLESRPNVGMVQTRWGHLNATYSALTRAQAIALDGHFIIEQVARSRNHLFMNFNGAGGVWRKTCIEQAGGWSSDTLTEDLDLSYRAQLRGWELMFLPDVVAPAELPPQLNAFKRQQFRWAKGSTQCLFKLAPQIARATELPMFKRIQGLLHLSGYLMNLLMVVLLLALVPLIGYGMHLPALLMVLSLTVVGPVLVFSMGQRALYQDWGARLSFFPVLMFLGVGLSLSNSLAVLEGIFGGKNNFHRTPKFSVESEDDAWKGKRYAIPFGWGTLGEISLALYALVGVELAWQHHALGAIPFLLLYAAGFGFTAWLGVWHSRPVNARGIEFVAASN